MGEWRHMTEGKQRKCVSGVRVETHYEEKTAKMCVQGVSGDTLRAKKQQKCVSEG
jgi:hypothetical protein